MLGSTFLLLQKFFKKQPHPFNEHGCGKLNYSEFEYKTAADTFGLFSGFGDVKKFVKNKRVLDIACGGGGKSVWLAEKGAKKVTGIDLEEIFIEQAVNFAKEHKVKCEFLVEDASKLSFEDESFDLVVLNDVMEHVSEPVKVLAEAGRVLRKGGRVFINMEPYFHPNGSHMMDVFTMPWNHVFFSEKFRIRMYKKLVKDLPDGEERVKFRISEGEDGEYVGYLNHMTIGRFEEILAASYLEPIYLERKVFRRFYLLARLPILREFFTRFLVVVLEKQ